MTSRILYILISCFMILSCSGHRVIPRDTLAHIYADIYLADQYIQNDKQLRKLADTLFVYEPIFNKYGYTSEEYDNSVIFYLKRSDKFAEIFEDAQDILKARSGNLERILNRDSNKKEFEDTLNSKSSKHILYNDYYRILNMLFYNADTIIIKNAPIVDSSLINPVYDAYHLYEKLPSLKNPFNAVLPAFTDTTIVVKHIIDSLDIKLLRNIMDSLNVNLQRNTIDSLDVRLFRNRIDSLDIKLVRNTIDSLDIKRLRSTIDSLDIKLLRDTIDTLDIKSLKNIMDSLDVKLQESAIDSIDIKTDESTIDGLELSLIENLNDNSDVRFKGNRTQISPNQGLLKKELMINEELIKSGTKE